MMLKVTLISDTHTKHNQIINDLPGGDILIHAGDFMNSGYNPMEAMEFFKWFDEINNYDTKIFIAGNHDRWMQNEPEEAKGILTGYKTINYLQDEMMATFQNEEEAIKIYGSPWQPEFFNGAFNLERGSEILEKWNMIPLDTDILITHGPAYGECDWVVPRKKHGGEHVKFTDGGCVGCEDLLDVILNKVCPKFHISGHIHTAHGESFKGNTHFINASTLNERYEVQYQPIIFET